MAGVGSIDKIRMSHKGLILVGVPLLFEFLFVAVFVLLLNEAQAEIDRANHAKSVIETADELSLNQGRAGGLFLRLQYTSTPAVIQTGMDQLHGIGRNIDENLNELQKLVQNDKQKYVQVQAMRATIIHARSMMEREAKLFFDPDLPMEEKRMLSLRASWMMLTSSAELNQMNRDLLVDLRKIESESPQLQQKSKNQIELALIIFMLFNVAVCCGLARFFGRNITDRLMVMNENAHRMVKNQMLLPQLKGSDEIAQLDRSFHNMSDSLREIDRLKQEFQAMITHDLRSPLSAIYSTLQLVTVGALGEVPDKAKAQLERSKVSAEYLLGLVSDLLDVSKLESKSLPMEFVQTDAPTVVGQSVDAVRALAERKDVTIETSCQPLTLTADGARLARVYINLLSNAIKFSPKGGKVTVSVKEEDGWLATRISDQGRGISPEDQKRIFDKYEQVETSDTTLLGGTGLGLSICKAIIDCHQGIIGVDSEPGRGSTFWFRIPLLQQPVEESVTAATLS